jgi:Domain of unknown function (DUF4421)
MIFSLKLPGLCKYPAVLVVLLSIVLHARAQRGHPPPEHDSSYYNSYREKLVARIYLSRKYNSAGLEPGGAGIPDMKYKPNSTLNIGIGATYRSLTINIGIGITSFNPDNEKGVTHYLDLQAHLYTRHWNFDLIGQFYRGYYLTPQGLAAPEGKTYYVRPDLNIDIGGLAVFRALNEKKFSFQAGLVNNEWQKKSAGSILIGGQGIYGSMNGDSTLVPTIIDSSYAAKRINKLHFFELGPGIGYAYAFIYKQHYYALASIATTINFRYSREIEAGHYADKTDFSPAFSVHAAIGYNTEKWNLAMIWVASQFYVRGQASNYQYTFLSGNYRLMYARRFNLNRKVKKVLSPISEMIDVK